MFFKTQRLLIDELTMEDVGRWHEIANQSSILRWMEDWEMDREQVSGLLRYFIDGYSIRDPKQNPLALAIRLKESRRLIGMCGFGPKDELAGNVEICYFIDAKHKRRNALFLSI